MADVMLDLETLGSNHSSVIVAIGAVKFNPAINQVTDRFYTGVNPQSCVDAGMKMDVQTIIWWMKQSDAARKVFEGNLRNIGDALKDFTGWLGEGDHKIWGNGATFDNVILSNAFRLCNMRQPWPFWGDMCYRTIKSMYPQIKIDRTVGVHHNAVHDAENQALHLMKLWPMLNARLS